MIGAERAGPERQQPCADLTTRAGRWSRWIGEPGAFLARTHDEGAAVAAARRRTTPGTSSGRPDSRERLPARVLGTRADRLRCSRVEWCLTHFGAARLPSPRWFYVAVRLWLPSGPPR